MQSSTSFILMSLLAASTALKVPRQANVFSNDSPLDEYFAQVCLPTSPSGDDDLNAPCNALAAIGYQCMYGSAQASSDEAPIGNLTVASPASQQICYCQSQWFNFFQGCVDCATKHGVGAIIPQVAPTALSSVSSSYCAASNTPTNGLPAILNTAFGDAVGSASAQTATTFSDPIGNKTDVSLYFTASVTGSAAYIVSQAVATSGGVSASATASTSVFVSNGQIGPTAGANAASAASSTTPRSSGLAAMATPCLEKIIYAGAIGLAGAAAML